MRISTLVVIRLSMLLMTEFADDAEGLTHGRLAEPGEFPSVVRIRLHDIDAKEMSRVSTGVLITTTQVLTTCDSVGFLNNDRVKLYGVSEVTIRGGGVTRTSGIKKTPNSSRVHPRCYFLSSGVTLFNFGIYEFDKPFTDGFNNDKLLRPVKNLFVSGTDMGRGLKKMWTEFKLGHKAAIHCYSAGWGHPVRVYEGQGEPDNFQAISPTLQMTNMTVVDFDYCSKTTCEYFDDCFISIWEYGFVCAQAEAGGPCRNDKGAPLICEGQIFAIHVNPQACSEKAIPRHFLRIDLAFDFVFGISGCSEFRLSADYVVMAAVVTIVRW